MERIVSHPEQEQYSTEATDADQVSSENVPDPEKICRLLKACETTDADGRKEIVMIISAILQLIPPDELERVVEATMTCQDRFNCQGGKCRKPYFYIQPNVPFHDVPLPRMKGVELTLKPVYCKNCDYTKWVFVFPNNKVEEKKVEQPSDIQESDVLLSTLKGGFNHADLVVKPPLTAGDKIGVKGYTRQKRKPRFSRFRNHLLPRVKSGSKTFKTGMRVEVYEGRRSFCYSPKVVLERAHEIQDWPTYHLFTHNCVQWAHYVKCGSWVDPQVIEFNEKYSPPALCVRVESVAVASPVRTAVTKLRLRGVAPATAALHVFAQLLSADHEERARLIRALQCSSDRVALNTARNISTPSTL